ncbi:MAG: TIGR02646 family protein [Acidobacteria bacterium]|nr:TIGR02646 family protein [Acidobacteriota bacterium]
MKHIVKREEPEAFINWKSLSNDDWQPTFGNLPGEVKNVVRSALMAEQGWICCYCERRLSVEDSHLEHLRPQSDPEVDPLDFGNLLCSCQNQISRGEPRHCGNLKDNWNEPEMMVSPLDPNCESRFAYDGDGFIRPVIDDDRCARMTIEKLGLAISKLNDLRASAIKPFLDDDLSPEEFRLFVAGYLARDEADRYGEFWTTIRHLFGGLIAT